MFRGLNAVNGKHECDDSCGSTLVDKSNFELIYMTLQQ